MWALGQIETFAPIRTDGRTDAFEILTISFKTRPNAFCSTIVLNTCYLLQWSQSWQPQCSSNDRGCRADRKAPSAHCTPQPWHHLIWYFLFGFRTMTMIFDNLSVEEEVDKLWECGCSCIPSQRIISCDAQEIQSKFKEKAGVCVKKKDSFQFNMKKYLGSLATSVSLGCLKEKFRIVH